MPISNEKPAQVASELITNHLVSQTVNNAIVLLAKITISSLVLCISHSDYARAYLSKAKDRSAQPTGRHRC